MLDMVMLHLCDPQGLQRASWGLSHLLLTMFSKVGGRAGRQQSLFPSCRWGEWPEKGDLPGITQLGRDEAGIQPQAALEPSQRGGPQACAHTHP